MFEATYSEGEHIELKCMECGTKKQISTNGNNPYSLEGYYEWCEGCAEEKMISEVYNLPCYESSNEEDIKELKVVLSEYEVEMLEHFATRHNIGSVNEAIRVAIKLLFGAD